MFKGSLPRDKTTPTLLDQTSINSPGPTTLSDYRKVMSYTDTKVQLSDGATLRVRVSDIELRDKPLLIALHGAPGLSSHAEPEAAYSFLGDQFRVLVYDARGSGASDLKGPFTDERWIADVDELR